MQWTLYVDIDAYYVSCELRDRPELRGRPVIVGPDPHLGPTRGVVLSASYEARAFGVRSALPVGQAARLCAEAVWIPADFPKYGRISEELRSFLGPFGDRVVALSIDEAAVEVVSEDPADIALRARSIQAGLRESLQLPSSIGCSPYRLVAKIASDRAKPGGVVVVPPAETRSFVGPLNVGAIPGIGPKTQERLRAVGVERIEQLLTVSPVALRSAVGMMAGELIALASGTPRPLARDESGPRSRSTAETFLLDVGDLSMLTEAMDRLATSLSKALEEEHLRFRTVTVAVRWADFQRAQRSQSLGGRRGGVGPLQSAGRRLLTELWRAEGESVRRKVRTLSLSAERLASVQPSRRGLESFATEAREHD